MADRIEREIVIDAPPSVVWDVLTDPAKVAQWWSNEADFEPRPGVEGRLIWTNRGVNAQMAVMIRVAQVEPERRFSFVWDYPAGSDPHPGNAPLVEFTLTADGAGTRLRLVESGINALERPAADREAYWKSHVAGWDVHLSHLREYAVHQVPLAQ